MYYLSITHRSAEIGTFLWISNHRDGCDIWIRGI